MVLGLVGHEYNRPFNIHLQNVARTRKKMHFHRNYLMSDDKHSMGADNHWIKTHTHHGWANKLLVAHRTLIPVSFCNWRARSANSSRFALVSSMVAPVGARFLVTTADGKSHLGKGRKLHIEDHALEDVWKISCTRRIVTIRAFFHIQGEKREEDQQMEEEETTNRMVPVMPKMMIIRYQAIAWDAVGVRVQWRRLPYFDLKSQMLFLFLYIFYRTDGRKYYEFRWGGAVESLKLQEVYLSWKVQYLTPSFWKNWKATRSRRLAFTTLSVPSSHGRANVGRPNGSAPTDKTGQ